MPDTARKPTLGIVAIAKNEERDMPHFLGHLLPWVDEIVVVDNGSTDRTLELLHAAGDRVQVLEQPMDPVEGFAGLRNRGIEAASADWLLHMDIDERVTPQLAAEIRRVIADTTHNGFRYHRLNFFLHRPMRGGGWQYWNHPQLGRRGFHRFVNPIHEACMIDGGDGKTGQLHAEMWHLNDEDYVERVTKNLRYMQMSGQQILDKGVRVRWYHLLFYPLYRAFRSYFVDGGFRTGTTGLVFAMYTLSSSFNWWAWAWERQNHISRENLDRMILDAWQYAAAHNDDPDK
jgi:glycosyltransferase involved in cell wall biosynthesis